MCDTNSNVEPAPRPAAELQLHSNNFLLKINTHDKYSTVGAIKKQIAKDIPPPKTQSPPAPLFKGMQRIGKNPKNPHIFLAFESEEDRNAARDLLVTMMYRKLPWCEESVSERDLQLTHKGKQDDREKRPREVEPAADGSAPLGVCTWANVPLAEQLSRKEQHCIAVMRKIVPPHQASGKFRGVMGCTPTEGYRNHVNFSFGRDAEGHAVVGFNEGSIVDGKINVQRADERAVTTHVLSLKVASCVQQLHDELRAETGGKTSVMDRCTGTGFWRRLQVRHNVDGELMLCFELDPVTGLPETHTLEDVVKRIVERLTSDFFTHELRLAVHALPMSSTARVVSVQYYTHTGTTSCPLEIPRTVVYGSPAITETLCGLKFDVVPPAFFQVNTPGMELMLREVLSVAQLTPRTTLLDLCCGTGTIGLCLAQNVRRVIGIEIVASAVESARANATRNGITSATFYAGRVENILPDVLNGLGKEDREDVVAILDPPRAGVHPTVLKWIRSMETIRRVVYISCDQKSLENDCPPLTKPPTNTYRGNAFEIESGFGVDLFPHTPHVEMVAVLVRKSEVAPSGVADSIVTHTQSSATIACSSPDGSSTS